MSNYSIAGENICRFLVDTDQIPEHRNANSEMIIIDENNWIYPDMKDIAALFKKL